MLGGIGARTFGILEKESTVVAHFAHQGERLLIILFRLGVETAEKVGRNGTIRNQPADSRDPVQVPFARIFTVHHLQDARTARLSRQVNHLAQVVVCRNHAQRIVAHVFRMRRGEADTHGREGLGHPFQQNGEGDLFRSVVVEVRVDILSQQRHLLETLLLHVANLVEDALQVAAPFASACVGHDTIGTEIVAATHDADKARNRCARQLQRNHILVGLRSR